MHRKLLLGTGVVLLGVLWVIAAHLGPTPTSTGTIIATDSAIITLVHHGRRTNLLVGNPTVMVDSAGNPLRVSDLRTGDRIHEECISGGLNRFLA